MTRLSLAALLVGSMSLAACASSSVPPASPCGAPPAKPLPEHKFDAPAPNMTWDAGEWACDGVRYVWVPGHWE